MAKATPKTARGQVSDTAAAVLTAGIQTQILANKLFNTDTSALTVTVYKVPAGGSATTANILFTVTINASESAPRNMLAGEVLGAGDALFMVTGTAAKVNWDLSYQEIAVD